jgi:hypothetical protein
LPSGKALAEFALQAGFLAPPLFNVERFGGVPRCGRSLPARSLQGGSEARTVPSRVKQCGSGKGSGE